MRNNNYYKWVSYRRKFLDLILEKYKHLYHGVVLDIGGRERGKFRKPKENVEKWIFADINKELNPDMVLDVQNMIDIPNDSIDVISATELFEHVQDLEKGIKECYRVLKNKGIFIISIPFLFPIHSDPFDFQRFTESKWKQILNSVGFEIEKIIIMGKYYTLLSELLKFNFKRFINKRLVGSIISYLIFPFLDHIAKKDFKKSRKSFIDDFPCGYFIIAKKK